MERKKKGSTRKVRICRGREEKKNIPGIISKKAMRNDGRQNEWGRSKGKKKVKMRKRKMKKEG